MEIAAFLVGVAVGVVIGVVGLICLMRWTTRPEKRPPRYHITVKNTHI